MEKNKVIAGGVILTVLVAGGSFYGGMRYGSNKNFSRMNGQVGNRPGQNINGDMKSSGKFQDNKGQRPNSGRQGGEMGGFLTGQITAKDDKSFTLKSSDGNSKIVFFSEQSTVARSNPASSGDLSVGQEVLISGKNNPDGSVYAQNVQIKITP